MDKTKTGGAKVGDKVRMMDAELHAKCPRYYPETGTIGTVEKTDVRGGLWVKWPKGTTNGDGCWHVPERCVAFVDETAPVASIKAGDTVTLIDKPWECELWGSFSRIRRLKYKEFIGKEHVVNFIIQPDDVTVDDISGNACADIGDYHVIPLALLRKVEPKTDGKNADVTIIEELPSLDKLTPMARGPHPEIKAGTKFVCVKDNLDFKRGETVTLDYNDNTGVPRFKPGGWALWENFAPLEPAKHRYTAEQEREARELIGKIVAEMDTHTSLFFGYPHNNNDTKLCYMPQGGEYSDYIARCSPNDEFNQTIGRMVALCKATGTPLPEWVKP